MGSRPRRNLGVLYGLGVIGLYVGVAVVWWDVTRDQIEWMRIQWAVGGLAAAGIVGYGALLVALLAFVTWVIARRPEPRRDTRLLLFATVLGWGAEAWGTRTGLWEYYTGEAPPGWIVPAWSLGALVVYRVSRWVARVALSRAWQVGLYATISVITLVFFVGFARPAWGNAGTAICLAILIATFAVRPEPARDVPVLLAGLACVFVADSWGTGSDCYRYHTDHEGVFGAGTGVLFGMLFDTAVVLAAGRLAALGESPSAAYTQP